MLSSKENTTPVGRRIGQKVSRTLIGSLFEGASALGRLHPRSKPAKHGIEVLKDIAYQDTGRTEHLLDIYRPVKRQSPSPVVFYVHGGGFRFLSKDSHWLMALIFAKFGYTVVTINYRLVPEGCFPIALQDTFNAYRWMVEHADEYDLDLDRLVVAGESAGGNLISALMIATCYQRAEPWARAIWDLNVAPKVAMPACGLLQVSDPGRFKRRRPDLSRWFSSQVFKVCEGYVSSESPSLEDDFANPLLFFEKKLAPDRPLPATFATCGTKDPLIDDSRRLVKALRSMDVAAEAAYYKGGLHAFHALVWLRIAKECWRDHYNFLEKQFGKVKVDAPALEYIESLSQARA